MAHEGQRQVITNARYAGGPEPGKPGWMDEEKAARLVAKGSARYADRLSERIAPKVDDLEALFAQLEESGD